MKLQFNGRFLSQVITNNGQVRWGYKDEVFCCICKKAKDIKNFFDEFNINNELTAPCVRLVGTSTEVKI